MPSSRTKQISVYGKRSTRIVLVENENAGHEAGSKPDRVPLIHRMKKRENGPSKQKLAVKSKLSSPQRAVSLTKQRVVPGGSPTGKSAVKRGTRVAEILAEEAARAQVYPSLQEGKKTVPGTPSRVPFSSISKNSLNSPAVSSVQIVVRKQKKKHCSPKSLVTSKALSTIQMDIEVLDEEGQIVNCEKKMARTDIVVIRNKENGDGKTSKKVEVQIAANPRPRPASRSNQLRLVTSEVISIPSSTDEGIRYTEANPVVLSNNSSTADDSESSAPRLPPVRKSRRAPINIINSDDEDEDQSDEVDAYLSLSSSPVPSRKSSQKPILAASRNSVASHRKTEFSAASVTRPSGLKVEVVIPPAPYRINKPTLPPVPPPLIARVQTAIPSLDTWRVSPKTKKPSASALLNAQGRLLSRYPHMRVPYPTAYNLGRSPALKTRQLTPIRHKKTKGTAGNSSLFAYGRGIVSSPTTPTDSDFDLSLEFSQLDISVRSDELEALDSQGCNTQLHYPEYLTPLLEECHQKECGPYEFSAFIQTFPFDPILQDARRSLGRRASGETLTFRKIGEASYSEVFGIGDVVLKVIPLRDESRTGEGGLAGTDRLDGPAPTDAKDVRKEIIVTRAMGEVHERFVKLLKTYVVRGKYPEVLLKLWDEYDECKGSESVRPDTFTVSQIYAIIVLPNGGPDLETYTFSNALKTGWRQAASLFWQVAKALAHAEKLVSFEHRDLHWGQILVKDLQQPNKQLPLRPITHILNQKQNRSSLVPSSRVGRAYMDDLGHGVQATIIDLGLSRMDAGDGSDKGHDVQWTPFEEEVFMGEGDYQFDVYRMMKRCIGEDWKVYHPLTNILWLHYLVTKLLRHKNLKAPRKPRPSATVTNNTPIDATLILHNIRPTMVDPLPSSTGKFSEQDCYDALVDIEEWLGKCIAEVVPPLAPKSKGKVRPRKTSAVITDGKVGVGSGGGASTCSCAGQVVGYGVKRGWIRPVPS